MSDPYHSPEEFGLKQLFEADAGGAWEFDKLVIWLKTASGEMLMGTDSGCSCPSPFQSTTLSDLEIATPEGVREWFDTPEHSPRRGRLRTGEQQKALALFEKEPKMEKDLDKEILEAKQKLTDLEAKKAIIAKMTPNERVAVAIHDLLCHSNHADQCGWYYEIDKEVHDWSRYAHADALFKADALMVVMSNITTHSEALALATIKALKERKP